MLEELRTKLEQEIERLTHELQVVLPRAIKTAVEHGDLRENSEYKSALERQQFVQARLNHLTRRMQELSKIDLAEIPSDRVGFGSRVTVRDVRTKDNEVYTLVFGDYIDIETGQTTVDTIGKIPNVLLAPNRLGYIVMAVARTPRKPASTCRP